MKWKRVLIIVAVICVAGISFHCGTGYLHGRTDYYVLSQGESPVYAKQQAVLSDGGTVVYRGRGYVVYQLHRTLHSLGTNAAPGYLGGAKIEWALPIRIFERDDEYYFFIPAK